jgi:hypothetical protein
LDPVVLVELVFWCATMWQWGEATDIAAMFGWNGSQRPEASEHVSNI